MSNITTAKTAETTNAMNTATFEFSIDEIEVKGITLKGLSMKATADFSDEKVRMETEGAVQVLKMVLGWADGKIDRLIEHAIEADQHREERRDRQVAAEIDETNARTAESEARAARIKAEEETEKLRAEKLRKDLADI